MLRLLLTIIWVVCLGWLPLQAQTNKTIRDLQTRRTELQKQISQSEKILLTVNKDVKSQLSNLAVLNSQMAQQELLLKTIEADVKALEKEISSVERQLKTLEADINDKKNKYEQAMKHAYLNNRGVKDKLMFVFSANTVSQMYRRARYIREYSVHLKVQAEQIQIRHRQIQQKRSDLLMVKGEKSNLLRQQEKEKAKLESQQGQRKKLVNDLQKKQKSVQQEINRKKKQHQTLNAQIDKLVEQEIAAVKKREEEKRKKEQARLEAERKKKEGTNTATRSTGQNTQGNATASTTATNKATATSKSTSSTSATTAKPERMDVYDVSSAERKMAGSFESNKGKLPMPITGAYTIVSHYGANNVSGLKNVSVDNKGIDIKGQAGASARVIFDGEVSAVFSYGGVKGVLVRHGNYISVYVNLSSVSVRQGQKVKARDVLGKVANSREDGYVLHFQLRKETTKLNPESWLKK